jgi:predicted thioredoxin/glutaredoxin
LGSACPQIRRDSRLAWLEREALVRIADSSVGGGVLWAFLNNMDMRCVLRRLAQRSGSLWSEHQYKIGLSLGYSRLVFWNQSEVEEDMMGKSRARESGEVEVWLLELCKAQRLKSGGDAKVHTQKCVGCATQIEKLEEKSIPN